ncbi:MAG: hypothetical protein ACQEWG_00735 [Bacteroidota bacterium]
MEFEDMFNTAQDCIDYPVLARWSYGFDCKTIPDNAVISELAEFAQSKWNDKAILSGYTDVSGNAKIHKRLTDSRLEYLKTQIATFIPLNKIYLQYFGDAFASKILCKASIGLKLNFL